jgi:hypothetical protein
MPHGIVGLFVTEDFPQVKPDSYSMLPYLFLELFNYFNIFIVKIAK